LSLRQESLLRASNDLCAAFIPPKKSEEPKETRDQHLLWASSSGIKLYKGTNIVGQILFPADKFWLKNCPYRDETAVFQGVQPKLRTATPITNAQVR
jgi:hypothetical protein